MDSRVRPALTEAELVNIFMITLQGMYYENMVDSSLSKLADIVTIGECIENGLKTRKIASIYNQTVAKKYHSFAKNKEAKASVVIASVYPKVQAPMASEPYCPYSYIAAAQY